MRLALVLGLLFKPHHGLIAALAILLHNLQRAVAPPVGLPLLSQ